MESLQVSIHHGYRERIVELQGGPQHILFIPRPPTQHPLSWILERVEDIVNVNVDAGIERREDIEEQVVDVAACLADALNR